MNQDIKKPVEKIKKMADNGEYDYVKLALANNLTVDPTFTDLREAYEYVQKFPSLWAEHKDMTPLINDRSKWNEDYWSKLQTDLEKNFSRKRFDFMRTAAPVIFAKKVSMANKTRNSVYEVPVVKPAVNQPESMSVEEQIARAKEEREQKMASEAAAAAERERKREEARMAEAARRAEEARKVEAARKAEAVRKNAAAQQRQPQSVRSAQQGIPPKKSRGAGVLLAVIAVIAIIVLLIITLAP